MIRLYTFILFTFLLFYSNISQSQIGALGVGNVNAPNTVLNTYAFLTADAAIGATTLTVNSNAMIGGAFGLPLAAGDLILIIQMQGASIDNSNTANYGSITNYNNSGNNEFRCVESVVGANEIIISVPLSMAYTAAGKTQVVRIPRYADLTIGAAGIVTTPAWNGQIGGVVAIEVQNNIVVDGQIDASGQGFRGGARDGVSAGSVFSFVSINPVDGGQKGEGIAGYEADYDAVGGRYCIGAAANGGGGGNSHNAGGGGGANAGIIAWNGFGNPDISGGAGWIAAWNLEGAGFSANTSSGGGRGGYSYSDNNRDATTTAPGNPTWGGFNRENNGGFGGRPLDYSTGKIFLGGGGGSGDENSGVGTGGASGGGLVYILSHGAISGTGSVLSNGASAPNDPAVDDGLGGGGAGGTIILNSIGLIAPTITISANGGGGGNHITGANIVRAFGPGGGGGGGYVALSSPGPAISVLAGPNGINNTVSMSEFPPNGATRGGGGIDNGVVSFPPLPVSNAGPNQQICDIITTTTLAANLLTSEQMGEWTVIAGVGGVFADIHSPTSDFTGNPNSTYQLQWEVKDIFCRSQTSTVNITFNTVDVTVNPSNVQCNGGNNGSVSVVTNSGGPYTYQWSIGGTDDNVNNLSANIIYTVTISSASNCVITQTVQLSEPPLLQSFLTNSVNVSCNGFSDGEATVNANGGMPALTYSWSTIPVQNTLIATGLSAGTYTFVVTDDNNCISTTTVTITEPLPFTINPLNSQSICGGQNLTLTAVAVGGSGGGYVYNWQPSGIAGSTISFPTNVAGDYTVTATDNGCVATATVSVVQNPLPVVSYDADIIEGCELLCVNFTNNTANTSTVTWYFGDGQTDTSPNGSHCYTNGIYSTSLTVTDNNNCSSTVSTSTITVYPEPIADFVADPNKTTILESTIHFTDASTGGSSWQWNFGTGVNNTSTQQNPTYTYDNVGTYTVSLIVTNSYGCDDTTYQEIEIREEYSMYVPNAFTPDGDGLNDVFIPKHLGLDPDKYELLIYDRWGTLIFRTNSVLQGWDGKANGGKKIAQQDVYVWKVVGKDVYATPRMSIGHLSLIR